MEQFKDYFNNRTEIEEFFKNEVFLFCFYELGKICFTTVLPKQINDKYYFFELTLIQNKESIYNNYSSFNDGLNTLYLEEVVCIEETTKERTTMYKQGYIDPTLN